MRYIIMLLLVAGAAIAGGVAGYQMPEPVVVPVVVTELVEVPRQFKNHERIAVYFDGHSVPLDGDAAPEPVHNGETLEYVVHVEWDPAKVEGEGMAFQLVLQCSDGAYLAIIRGRPASAGQIWAEDLRKPAEAPKPDDPDGF